MRKPNAAPVYYCWRHWAIGMGLAAVTGLLLPAPFVHAVGGLTRSEWTVIGAGALLAPLLVGHAYAAPLLAHAGCPEMAALAAADARFAGVAITGLLVVLPAPLLLPRDSVLGGPAGTGARGSLCVAAALVLVLPPSCGTAIRLTAKPGAPP